VVNKYKFTCQSCNKEIGRSETGAGGPPLKCKFCGGIKIATQKLEMDDRRSFDYEVSVLNKSTGRSIRSSFTISPEEYVGLEGAKLKVLIASKLAESLSMGLNQRTSYELIEEGKV